MRLEADKPNTVARWIKALNHNVEEEDINIEQKQVLVRLFFVLFISSQIAQSLHICVWLQWKMYLTGYKVLFFISYLQEHFLN